MLGITTKFSVFLNINYRDMCDISCVIIGRRWSTWQGKARRLTGNFL